MSLGAHYPDSPQTNTRLQLTNELQTPFRQTVCPFKVSRRVGGCVGPAVLRAIRTGPHDVKTALRTRAFPRHDVNTMRGTTKVAPVHLHNVITGLLKGFGHGAGSAAQIQGMHV